ncbi:MAG: hypothetical protein RL742_1700 [Bacteroidota bacterium]|jgi:hypothetical protein
MHKTRLTAFLAVLCLAGIQAQSPGTFSRFTLGPEIGSGLAIQTCCYDSYGFYTLGANGEYRFTRHWSAEGALRYINMEGVISGYDYGNGYDFGSFQQVRNVALTVGPRFNLPMRKGREFSISGKAGLMLNRIRQDITNNSLPFQTRTYRSNLLPTFELGGRLTRWLTDRVAVESFLTYFANTDDGVTRKLKTEEGLPFPEPVHDAFPGNFVGSLNDRPGELAIINFGLGIRIRL